MKQEQINAKIEELNTKNEIKATELSHSKRLTGFTALNGTQAVKSERLALALIGGITQTPNKDEIQAKSLNMLNKKDRADLNSI